MPALVPTIANDHGQGEVLVVKALDDVLLVVLVVDVELLGRL